MNIGRKSKIFSSLSVKTGQPPLPFTFGGASISGEGGGYGFGNISEQEAIELLHFCLEKGIRAYDTAPIYGFGLSEERIGKAFKNQRDHVFIISKSGVDWHSNKRVNTCNTQEVTSRMLDESLKRLQSDYIDLYMIHWPDANVDIRQPMEVLSKAKADKKIKYIGLCNTNISELEKARTIDQVDVVQNEFNFLSNNIKDDLFPYLKTHQIDFMSYGTFAKGILSGRVTRERKDYSESDLRSWAPWWKGMDKEKLFKSLDQIKDYLDQIAHNGLELAIAHNLMHEEVSTLICGFRNSQQVSSALEALQHLPNSNQIEEAMRLSRKNE